MMTEIEELTFDDLEASAAVLYAAARRYCILYEAIELPDEDRSTDSLSSAGHRVMRAANKWHEAFVRWNKLGETPESKEDDDEKS